MAYFGKIEKVTCDEGWEAQGSSLMEGCDQNAGTSEMKILYTSNLNVKLNNYRVSLAFTSAVEMGTIEEPGRKSRSLQKKAVIEMADVA